MKEMKENHRKLTLSLVSLILTTLTYVASRSGSPQSRLLTSTEKASSIGGWNDYLNRCCQPASNCVLPSTTQCSTFSYNVCKKTDLNDYYITSTNQNDCSGTKTSQICTESPLDDSTACVVSYHCVIDPQTGKCTKGSRTVGVEFAPTSCSPNCPAPTGTGGP